MKRLILTAAATLSLFNVGAQTRWEARLDTVGAIGYYNIELSQQAIGLASSSHLDNIKILDEQGVEVPCLVQPSSPVYEESRMQMYDLKINSGYDSVNVVVIDNSERQNVDRFYVTMRSAEVDKWVSMRGSEDMQHWFVVKGRASLQTSGNAGARDVAEIYFPEGNYRYYEITITNTQRSPLEITGVGRMESSSIFGRMVEIDYKGMVVSVDSTDKSTVISFPGLRTPYRIAKLELGIGGQTFYRRDAAIYNGGSRVAYLELSYSKGGNTFFLDELRVDGSTTIRIENQNNPPLAIERVVMYGLRRYLCAWLEPDQAYTLMVGGERHGDYDIEYFKQELGADLPVIGASALQPLPDTPEVVRELRFFESKMFLWGIMIIVGGALVFVCLRALREVKKRES